MQKIAIKKKQKLKNEQIGKTDLTGVEKTTLKKKNILGSEDGKTLRQIIKNKIIQGSR